MKKTSGANLHMHLLELEITTECNQNCQYCYNRENKHINMPLKDIIKYLKFAEENGVQVVVISGGEASLHPDFTNLCEMIRRDKFKIPRIVVQSNGFIRNIDLKYIKVFDSVHLSYELDDTSSRSISTEDNLELAKVFNSKGIYTYLFSTITKKNLKNIENVVTNANEAGVDIGFNICCDTGNNKDLLLSCTEKEAICRKMIEFEEEGKILPFKNPMTSIIRGRCSDNYLGIRGGCTAGIGSCVVSADGEVFPCPFFRFSVGNLKNESLEDIWLNSKKINLFRARKYFKDPCGKCRHLSFCGGCPLPSRQTPITGMLQM